MPTTLVCPVCKEACALDPAKYRGMQINCPRGCGTPLIEKRDEAPKGQEPAAEYETVFSANPATLADGLNRLAAHGYELAQVIAGNGGWLAVVRRG